ncbi:MAG: hypothetical protein H6934_00350 [Burkholderiaceae bacterium]|nr:hypothetical protein [Burkholderiaceae bacterium]
MSAIKLVTNSHPIATIYIAKRSLPWICLSKSIDYCVVAVQNRIRGQGLIA